MASKNFDDYRADIITQFIGFRLAHMTQNGFQGVYDNPEKYVKIAFAEAEVLDRTMQFHVSEDIDLIPESIR